jgi:hypothetical protein
MLKKGKYMMEIKVWKERINEWVDVLEMFEVVLI